MDSGEEEEEGLRRRRLHFYLQVGMMMMYILFVFQVRVHDPRQTMDSEDATEDDEASTEECGCSR